MTDLKTLLNEAAGDEPLLTDADLAADLTRGRRSRHRRRIAGIAATATATAAVVGVAFSLGAPDQPASTPVAGNTQQPPSKTCGQLRTEYGLTVTRTEAAHETTTFTFRLPGSEGSPAQNGRLRTWLTLGRSTWDYVQFTDQGRVQVPPPGKDGWSDAAWAEVTENCLDLSNAVPTVKLVASGKVLAGAKVWCDLKPAGWTPVVVPPARGQYSVGFRPPAGGAMLVVSRNDQGVRQMFSPGTLKWNSATEHRFMQSCHKAP